jgi:hypothetical protein
MRTAQDYINQATAALEADHFETKSAQKNVLDGLNRAYAFIRKDAEDEMRDRIRAAAGDDIDLYYAGMRKKVDLPFDLHQYRDRKHDVCFMGNTDRHTTVLKLVELRNQIKDMEVVKKPTKAQQEAVIRERSEITNIAAEFEILKPGIAQDYIEQVRFGFENMVKKYESNWTKLARMPYGSYDSKRWSFVRNHLRPVSGASSYGISEPMEIDEERLTKLANQYAEDQVTAFVEKLALKLVDLDDVTLDHVDPHTFIFKLSGTTNTGKVITVVQNIKYGTSKLGNPYVQWPALIYVDGQRISEATFKELVKG